MEVLLTAFHQTQRNLKRDDRTWMMTRNIQTWNDIIWSIASKVSWFVRSQPSRVQWTLIICISGFSAAAEDFKWHFCLFGCTCDAIAKSHLCSLPSLASAHFRQNICVQVDKPYLHICSNFQLIFEGINLLLLKFHFHFSNRLISLRCSARFLQMH